MKIRYTLWLAFGFIAGVHARSVDTSLLYTNLPLVVINTNGKPITDDPKITAGIKVIYKGSAILNHPSDAGNVYDGLCGIEYRGHYSQELPQKPYGFETRDAAGNNLNVSLLDMPDENDWILLANYNDKTFMRNTLAFHLFSAMGHYAPRANICELVLNGRYDGIYILTEKIKQDDHRVDIAGLDADDNAGDSLTGGYMFKTDYYDGSNSWLSGYSPVDRPGENVYFVYAYPDPDAITSSQKAYLKRYVDAFEDVLYGAGFDDPQTGYRAYLDLASFIDYFIIGELSRNVDAYKKSAFFFKDKDSKGGLLNRGPVWDFDWAWKNMNDNCTIFSATDGSGWAYKVNDCYNWPVAPAWIVRLMEDNSFQNEVFRRYFSLRKTLLSEEYIYHYIDSVHQLVEKAQARHYDRWPILGINVGTPEVDYQPSTYAGEIDKFRNWIETRLLWLDANLPGEATVSHPDALNADAMVIRIYPNPARDMLFIESEQAIQRVEIFNSTGRQMISTPSDGRYSCAIDVSGLNPGLFIVKIIQENNQVRTGKFTVE